MNVTDQMKGADNGLGMPVPVVPVRPLVAEAAAEKLPGVAEPLLKGAGVRVVSMQDGIAQMLAESAAKVGKTVADNIGESAELLHELNERNVEESREKERLDESQERALEQRRLSDEIVERQRQTV